jgi:hypothetical protein
VAVVVAAGGQPPAVDQAADGVGADAEQVGGLSDPECGHADHRNLAAAELERLFC